MSGAIVHLQSSKHGHILRTVDILVEVKKNLIKRFFKCDNTITQKRKGGQTMEARQ
jgi:hypothetical protein